MTGADLREWRARLELSQLEAAERLGLDERQVRRLEAAASVKRTIALACAAVAAGLKPDPFVGKAWRHPDDDPAAPRFLVRVAWRRRGDGGEEVRFVDERRTFGPRETARAFSAREADLLVATYAGAYAVELVPVPAPPPPPQPAPAARKRAKGAISEGEGK